MNLHAKSLRDSAQAKLTQAKRITQAIADENRTPTDGERKQVEGLLSEVAGLRRDATNLEKVDSEATALLGVSGAGTGLLAAFKSVGWEPGKKVALAAPLAIKGASFDGSTDDLAPDRREGASLGADRRYLYPLFPAQAVDAGTTSVQVVRQSSRTLADPELMLRAIDATTEKPETSTVRELVSLPMQQVASKESGIPNILLLQDGFRSTVDTDLRLAYEAALDDLVADAIAASTPAPAGSPGTDLTELIVFAAAAMAADGYNGSVVALSPEDAATLALLRGAEEQFARKDPLAGFRFATSPAVTTPLLIDPNAAGRLYLSGVTLATFEENDGATNSSLVRLEGTAAFHIERADAIRSFEAGS